MPEHSRTIDSLRAGPPLAVGSVTLLPIERVLVHAHRGPVGGWCSAHKAPYAMVIRDAGGLRAVDAGGDPFPLERLREEMTGLDALLSSI